jgi:hypothetical protein
MEIIGYIASILIGISIGLIGAGGSILAVPILVYLFHILPETATSYSLFIVGVTALLGAFRHYKLGNLHLYSALYFALPSVASLLLVRNVVLPKMPQQLLIIGGFELTKNILLMLVFAVLMIAASVSMIRKNVDKENLAPINLFRLTIIGFGVGIISGFLGAGGGFLVIPALIFFAGLQMKQAIGTSLLIIFINSTIGFSSDLFKGVHLDFLLLSSISAIAIIGMLIGTQLSKKISGAKLKPAFGWFVLIMGIFILVQELFIK